MSRRFLGVFLAVATATAAALAHANDPNPTVDIESLLRNLTLSEKLSFFHGEWTLYTGTIPGVQRLGIPPLILNDGPQGFAPPEWNLVDKGLTTAYPCNLALGASFSPDLVALYASSIASEFRKKGANVMLGPGLNLHRVAIGGRNFEYLTGEDPVLGSKLVKPFVEAVQQAGVMVTLKHYLNNNQEHDRKLYSAEKVDLDPGVESDLYLKPFISGLDAGACAVMCSYNLVNGTHSCENSEILGYIRGKYDGFFVMSDWFATHSTRSEQNHQF